MNVSTRYALLSLLRSTTRTLVSLIGVAVGCAIGLLATTWIRGEDGMVAESTAMSGQGHVQVVAKDWVETRDPRLRVESDWKALRVEVKKDENVLVATPQTETEALLGMGTRVQSVSLLGIDPTSEPKIRRTIRAVSAGRYLQADDDNSIVVGAELARRLDVGVGDELVVTSVSPGGDLNSALLTVIGTVTSGSKEIDSVIAHVLVDQAIELSGRKGVSRLSILLKDSEELFPTQARLKKSVARIDTKGEVRVLNWMEVNPALVAARNGDAAFSNAIIVVVILLVVLGITSAQLTGVLQRGREFSVLLALGMRRRTLFRLIFSEALMMGIAGGLLALLIAAGPLYYLSQVGVDLRAMMGEEGMNMNGVLLDPVMKADAGWWVVPYTLALAVSASLVGALYPALYSLRLDPASVLRSRN